MINTIVAIVLGFNIILIECMILFGVYQKKKARLVKNKLNIK